MADFAEYLRNESLPTGEASLAALLQNIKNKSAPIVSGSSSSNGRISRSSGNSGGSGGGVSGSASYKGALNLPKMSGKVLPTGARISQGWGKSRIKYAAGRHTGIDFGGAYGSKIKAAAAGVVTRTGSDGAFGNDIHIRHKDGTTTLYGHLSGITVKPGQRVKAGQNIGAMGHSGRAFGTHLHFEVRKQDNYGADINPRNWFSTR